MAPWQAFMTKHDALVRALVNLFVELVYDVS
jgi:hypothetical protein